MQRGMNQDLLPFGWRAPVIDTMIQMVVCTGRGAGPSLGLRGCSESSVPFASRTTQRTGGEETLRVVKHLALC